MLVKQRPAKQQKLPATALAEQQRKLEEDQRRVREEMERCQQLIAKAPEIKKERERLQREALIKKRATSVAAPSGSRTALPDPRYRHEQVYASTLVRAPRLRVERSQGKFMFFILLAAFIGMLVWVWASFARG